MTVLIVIQLMLVVSVSVPRPAKAALFSQQAVDLQVNGWLRQYFSVNATDVPETQDDDQWNFSMIRTSLYLDMSANFTRNFEITARSRIDEEAMPDYLQDLETLRQSDPAANFASAPDLQLDNFYDNAEVRELFADLNLTDQISMRLGRQIVVWGRTDLFQTMDIINGLDNTWRAVFAEDEQRRKPLWMANTTVKFPDLDGALQLIVRPGWDDKDEIGNSLDLIGGRWTPQPLRGRQFGDVPDNPGAGLTGNTHGVPFNFDHSEADADHPSYGMRWRGSVKYGPNVYEFTLNYLHTFNPTPLVNSNLNPYKGEITSANANNTLVSTPGGPLLWAEFIYPEIDLVGFTVNTFWPGLDIVPRFEAVYIPDKPYNIGSFKRSPTQASPVNPIGNGVCVQIPPSGLCGIKEKDTVLLSVGFDKSVWWVTDYLGAYRQGLLSVQLFDEWITGFEDEDQIVEFAPFGTPREEHLLRLTWLFQWNYAAERYNPFIKGAWDITNGEVLFIPGINVQFGDHWRIDLEGNFFLESNDVDPATTAGQSDLNVGAASDVHLPIGFLSNHDQVLLKLTYQF